MVLEAIRYRPSSEDSSASLEIIDQLLLPHQTVVFAIRTCEDAHAAIKQMRVRGAPAIAIVAALALAVEIQSEATEKDIPDTNDVTTLVGQRLDYLMTSRPTAVNLGDAVRKLKAVVKYAAAGKDSSGREVVEAYVRAAENMLVDDVKDNEAIGRHGAAWIVKNTHAGHETVTAESKAQIKVLTHCNTGSLATAGYGTALGVIRSLRSSGYLGHAYCTETRPYNQGSRLTAYELVHDDIPTTLITDSMAGILMAQQGQHLAAVVVGADRVAANGDTANKIGTYALAVLARYHGIKFLVAAPRTTIDLFTPSGKDIRIEQRPAEEITFIKGPAVDQEGSVLPDCDPIRVSIAAPGIEAWNPSFDVTPCNLIDGVITELGVVEPKQDGTFDFQELFEHPHQNGALS